MYAWINFYKLNTKEACCLLGCHRSTFYRNLKKGTVPKGWSKRKGRVLPLWEVLDPNWYYRVIEAKANNFAMKNGLGWLGKEILTDILLDTVYRLDFSTKKNPQGYFLAVINSKCRDFLKSSYRHLELNNTKIDMESGEIINDVKFHSPQIIK